MYSVFAHALMDMNCVGTELVNSSSQRGAAFAPSNNQDVKLAGKSKQVLERRGILPRVQ